MLAATAICAAVVVAAPLPQAALAVEGSAGAVHCADSRPAVRVSGPATRLGAVPCLSLTGFLAQEATIIVDNQGAVYYSPASQAQNALALPSGIAASTDRGASWKYNAASPAEANPVSNLQNCFCDPTVLLDRDTNWLFWFSEDNFYCGGNLNVSDDRGRTWRRTSQFGCPTTQDYDVLWTGKPVHSKTTDYPNILYFCSQGPVIAGGPTRGCVKSLDGGVTSVPVGSSGGTGLLPPPDTEQCTDYPVQAGHEAAAGPDGSIYLPVVACSTPAVAISRDEGDTWQYVFLAKAAGGAGGLGGQTVAVDDAGTVYAAYINDGRRPLLRISHNGGRTFGTPIDLAPAGVGAEAKIAAAATRAGQVAVAFWGSPTAGGPVSGYLAGSLTANRASPTFVTASVNDPRKPLCATSSCMTSSPNAGDRIDYLGAAVAPDGTAWGAFVADCAYLGNCDTIDKLGPSTVVGAAGSLRWTAAAVRANPPAGAPATPPGHGVPSATSGRLPATGGSGLPAFWGLALLTCLAVAARRSRS
jgi:hypothetical protein